MSRKLEPVSPGEMLTEEFLKSLDMSNYPLAKEIGVPAQRIGDTLAGRRGITITADTGLRLRRDSKRTAIKPRYDNNSTQWMPASY